MNTCLEGLTMLEPLPIPVAVARVIDVPERGPESWGVRFEVDDPSVTTIDIATDAIEERPRLTAHVHALMLAIFEKLHDERIRWAIAVTPAHGGTRYEARVVAESYSVTDGSIERVLLIVRGMGPVPVTLTSCPEIALADLLESLDLRDAKIVLTPTA